MSTIARVAAKGPDPAPGVPTPPTADGDAPAAPGLLALALSTPSTALEQARQLLSSGPDDISASYAHQAAGIVLRDRGDLAPALRQLEAALRCARRAGSAERETDVQATFGATEVMSGRTRPGLARLEDAASKARGLLLAKVRLRRAHVLSVLGRHEEALVDLRLALSAARRSRDRLWEARTLQNRSHTHLALGALGRAEADADTAARLFDSVGQAFESVQASHNRAIVAARRGDIPAALRLFDIVESRYDHLGVVEAELIIDRGHALLAAGLATEAATAAGDAIATGRTQPLKHAELLLFAARAALAAEQPEQAHEWARRAARQFRAQQRPLWETRARLLECQARQLGGERTSKLLTTVLDIAGRLDQGRDEDAPLALLLAARLAQERNQNELVRSSLTAAAGYRRHGSALTRATGWLAVAMQAASTETQRGLLPACGRGLDALDEYRLIFGAAELRAVATWHARDLAAFAVDAATRRGSTRQMLQWTERSRSTSLAEPAVRPTADPDLARELAAVRDAARRVEEAEQSGAPTNIAQQQRDGWEAAVRKRRRHLSGGAGSLPRLDIDELLASLGPTHLIALVESRGGLHAVVAGDGRLRRYEIGPLARAMRELDFAQFALRRAAHGRDGPSAASAARLQGAVLGPLARTLDSAPVVVVPSARLHAVPWGLLPALADVPLTVSPSVLMWSRASAVAAQPSADRRVLLVAGPDLGTEGSEVSHLATMYKPAKYPSVTVLGLESGVGVPATIDRVIASMSGAWVAHIAAHGSFRADSPLFSSLGLDDGALFVHDLDRLTRAPRNVVLSACDSGVSAPVGADELLGLVSGLLRVGTAGVLASVVPVNDEAAVAYMSSVHQALANGSTLPEAARQGRRNAAGDSFAVATAAAFSVWGA